MFSSLAHFWARLLAELKPLEVVAALVSIASVVLTAKERISNFPVGIVASALYGVVFWQGKLFSSAALQLFFIGICLWDWRQWAKGERAGGELRVRHTPLWIWAILIATFVVGTATQGYLILRFTSAQSPWIDSGLFWASVAAQWMIGRKFVENWLVWIGVDVVYVWLCWTQKLPVTSALYALFCVLAVWGWVEWARSRKTTTTKAPMDVPPLALP